MLSALGTVRATLSFVDEDAPVVAELENDIDEIANHCSAATRVYIEWKYRGLHRAWVWDSAVEGGGLA